MAERAYPGLALYHQGMDLVAVVSTGEDVWKLRVTGQLRNLTWSNVGIRWEPFDEERVNDKKGGLEVCVRISKQILVPLAFSR